MQLAVFGGTGQTGKLIVEQALAAGHGVSVLARNPAKLTIQNERLRVVQGEIGDAAKVLETVTGADAVISALGPTTNKPEFAVSKGMTNIIAAMRQAGVKRLIVTAGAGGGKDAKTQRKPRRRQVGSLRLCAFALISLRLGVRAFPRPTCRPQTPARRWQRRRREQPACRQPAHS